MSFEVGRDPVAFRHIGDGTGSSRAPHHSRRQRSQIETILLFLQDLDEIGVAEGDRSVYLDLALLFDDIATIAKAGALSMRHLGQFAALTAVGR